MEKISKEFVARTVRAVLFIFLVIIFCTAVSTAGIFLAARFGLTQSREQVPLTALSIGKEGLVELPGRGKMVEGDGWRLRNSRDIYTLTLDNAVIEGSAIDVTGDLILELKEESGNWIRSKGPGIRIQSGTLVIRGKGSLSVESEDIGIRGQEGEKGQKAEGRQKAEGADGVTAVRVEGGQLDIKGRYGGIDCREVELAGGSGTIEAVDENSVGIHAFSLKVEGETREITAAGKGAAVMAAALVPGKPVIETDKKVSVLPGDAKKAELQSGDLPFGEAGDMKETYNLITYSTEQMVTYNSSTGAFDGAAKEVTFIGE